MTHRDGGTARGDGVDMESVNGLVRFRLKNWSEQSSVEMLN